MGQVVAPMIGVTSDVFRDRPLMGEPVAIDQGMGEALLHRSPRPLILGARQAAP